MVVQYQMADGRIVEVETTAEVADTIAKFERKEASWRRKMRKHKPLSVEAIIDACAWEPTSPQDMESDYIDAEEREELLEAVEAMDESNRELIRKIFVERISARTIAKEWGMSFQAIYKRRNAARSK